MTRERDRPAPLPAAVITEVGESYINATSNPSDPLVTAAYRYLQTETDQLFHAARAWVDADHPSAVRIVFTCSERPYDSDRELIGAVRTSRVLEVTTAAVNSTAIHPLLGCEFGGAFDRFRAMHDLAGHAATGFGFDIQDEIAAWRIQDRLHRTDLARRALATEILAINSVISVIGEVPEHKALLLPSRLQHRAKLRSAA